MGNAESTLATDLEDVEAFCQRTPDLQGLLTNSTPNHDFDQDAYSSFAIAALGQSTTLTQLRFRIVPSIISEYEFWRRFAYLFDNFNLNATRDCSCGMQCAEDLDSASDFEQSESVFDEDFTQILLNIPLCFVYIVPKGESGLFANSWNLSSPIFTGQLEVVVNRQDSVNLRVFPRNREADDTPFVESMNISFRDIVLGSNILSYFIEPVHDSSRYFVVRVEDPVSGAKGAIGIGFKDRTRAFDLTAVLSDLKRRVARDLSMGNVCSPEAIEEDENDEWGEFETATTV